MARTEGARERVLGAEVGEGGEHRAGLVRLHLSRARWEASGGLEHRVYDVT